MNEHRYYGKQEAAHPRYENMGWGRVSTVEVGGEQRRRSSEDQGGVVKDEAGREASRHKRG